LQLGDVFVGVGEVCLLTTKAAANIAKGIKLWHNDTKLGLREGSDTLQSKQSVITQKGVVLLVPCACVRKVK
jgi:hypothetical protein